MLLHLVTYITCNNIRYILLHLVTYIMRLGLVRLGLVRLGPHQAQSFTYITCNDICHILLHLVTYITCNNICYILLHLVTYITCNKFTKVICDYMLLHNHVIVCNDNEITIFHHVIKWYYMPCNEHEYVMVM